MTWDQSQVLAIHLLGEPFAQKRHRARVARKGATAFVRTYDDPKNVSWKAWAQVQMKQALQERGGEWEIDGPFAVSVLAVFSLPKSDWRKREPVPAQWHTKQRGDPDNIIKAVLDAGTGILWRDDCQVSDCRCVKIIGEQGSVPRVRIRVYRPKIDSASLLDDKW